MIRDFTKYLGSGSAAAAALLLGGRIALADPPRVEPRAPEAVRETPREAARDTVRENRDTVRDARADRRYHRAPGQLGLRIGQIAQRGLEIASLASGSAFYNAGLRSGDYIVSVNGHRLVAQADFDRYLYADGYDQPVNIVVWRDGREVTINLQPNLLYTNDPYEQDLYDFGVAFNPQYTDQLVIENVYPDSLAYRAGLRVGDVITDWHGQRIRSPQAFARVIHDEKPGRVDFEYTRNSKPARAEVNFERRAENAERRDDVRAPGSPTVNPRADAREPRGPAPLGREPAPGVTPPVGREPAPKVTPPVGREPVPVTPPAVREPPRAVPPAATNPPRPAEPREAVAPREGK
jgi:membrane-associated protease RseP (regulator of RpoE activity)